MAKSLGVQMQLGNARVEGTTDHPQLQQRSKRLRRQAHHIKAIGRHAASGRRFGHPADVRAETALNRFPWASTAVVLRRRRLARVNQIRS